MAKADDILDAEEAAGYEFQLASVGEGLQRCEILCCCLMTRNTRKKINVRLFSVCRSQNSALRDAEL